MYQIFSSTFIQFHLRSSPQDQANIGEDFLTFFGTLLWVLKRKQNGPRNLLHIPLIAKLATSWELAMYEALSGGVQKVSIAWSLFLSDGLPWTDVVLYVYGMDLRLG